MKSSFKKVSLETEKTFSKTYNLKLTNKMILAKSLRKHQVLRKLALMLKYEGNPEWQKTFTKGIDERLTKVNTFY